MAVTVFRSLGKTAAPKQLRAEAQERADELSSLPPQPSQALCQDTPVCDAIAISRLIAPAWTADRLVLRDSKTPRSSAKTRLDGPFLMVVNMAAMPPLGKEDSSAARSNLKRLDNGDFLFRLARDLRSGIVYWAYMGSTRHVIAVAPDGPALADDSVARAALLRITDLPRRVGCGVGLIHRSWVYVVPEDVQFGESGTAPDFRPVLVMGEVRNDVSGRTPVSLLSYRNFVSGD